jgi:hypothetical protein
MFQKLKVAEGCDQETTPMQTLMLMITQMQMLMPMIMQMLTPMIIP